MSLQNMCLFDQCLEIVESIRNGGHCNDEYVELWSGLVVSTSGQCHCTIGCIHVVRSYLVRKAKINYKFTSVMLL